MGDWFNTINYWTARLLETNPAIFFAVLFIMPLSSFLFNTYKTKQIRNRILNLLSEPYHFEKDTIKRMRKKLSVPGIYVLRNTKTNKHYVGQSINIKERLLDHVSGNGNRMVRFAMEKGNQFEMMVIPLEDSGYKCLDKLEKHGIEVFNSYYKGYNRTRGNGKR